MDGGPYAIEFAPAAERGFERLPRQAQERIVDRIAELAREPRPMGVAKLKDRQDSYRIRVGDYRVLYHVDDRARRVTIALVGHRRDIYRSR
jgi:mRNA interferase RelE/StbE